MSRAGRCPYCNASLQVVHVHGHGQCSSCGTNVEPCCGGADAFDEADQGGARWQLQPGLLERLFDQLGGRQASVAVGALRHALVRALEVPLDEADEVIELGLRLGQLHRSGPALRLGPAA